MSRRPQKHENSTSSSMQDKSAPKHLHPFEIALGHEVRESGLLQVCQADHKQPSDHHLYCIARKQDLAPAKMFRNLVMFSALVGLNWDPQ